MIETKTYLLSVPGSPNSINHGGGGARANHFAAHREKKTWQGRFLMELLAAKVRKHMEFCKVEVVVVFKNRNRRDVENYRSPVIKPLADALVEGGYLKDDTDEWLQVAGFELHYPDNWSESSPFRDPRLKSYMDIRLEASYL